jgi:hypothetical protein
MRQLTRERVLRKQSNPPAPLPPTIERCSSITIRHRHLLSRKSWGSLKVCDFAGVARTGREDQISRICEAASYNVGKDDG